jgi:hypothetical protein
MATGAIVARILTQYSDKGSKQAQKDIKRLGADFDKFAKQSFRAFGLATAASAAFAAKIGVDAVQAAIADQKSQIILANSLRNTVGATDEAIAATEDYISAQQLLVGVSDTELRNSLLILASTTRSLTEAQALQNIALDVAASGYGDVESVSKALAKAYGGNIGALKRLVPGISATIVKTKDFDGAMKFLSETMSGAAAASANTLEGRLRILRLGYDEIIESLGYALLPVVQEFTGYLVSDVLPRIQEWVDLNKNELAQGLRTGAEFLKTFTERALAFGQWVTDNTGKVKAIATIIATMFVANKIAAFVVALKTITAAMAALRATAMGAAIATAFATAGVSVGTAAVALAAVGVTALVTKRYMDSTAKSTNKVTKSTKDLTNTTKNSTGITNSATTAITKYNAVTGATTNATKTLTAEQKKALEVQKQLNAQFGVTTKENDPIQLEAARLNLIKQQQLGYLAVDAAAMALFQSQVKINYEAERYKDIQLVIADQKLDNAEIDALAKKWSISREAVIAYIASVTGAGGILGLDSPGNVAAIGWKNALDAYNKYLAALGGKPEVTKPAAESRAAVSIASAATVGVGAEAAQKTYESMISQGYDTTAALSSARYAGMAEQYAASRGAAVAPTSGPVIGFTPTSQYGSTASIGTPFGQAGSVTVNVNAGSVIGSTDALVNTVREGILASQLSGKIIQLEALNL